MPFRVRNGRHVWLLILGAWLVPALLAAFNSFVQYRLEGRAVDWHWVLFNSLDWLAYALLTPVVFQAGRQYPLERPHVARNIGLHVIGALVMCAAWASLGTILRVAIFPAPATQRDLLRWFAGWVSTTLPFGFGVYFALIGIQHAVAYLAQARERESQAVRLAAQLSDARLSALRMQLHPHFLFNSLNAVTVLVRDNDTAGASRMLELLSDILRQILRNDGGHETTLSDELKFIERYLAIEQARFSDRLEARVDADLSLAKAGVPRFVLQPLVENAVRHGIASQTGPALLHISARRDAEQLVLTVLDNGPGLRPSENRSTAGVGLANTRARLAELYGDEGKLDVGDAPGGGVIATVRLPYHEA